MASKNRHLHQTADPIPTVSDVAADLQSDIAIPICVDLDGTLLNTDLLLESLLTFWRRKPAYFFMPFFWLLKGRSYLKTRLAESVEIDVSVLPMNLAFIEYLRSQHRLGRRMYLATAAARKFAENVAAHLGFFSGVFATELHLNLSGKAKAAALVEHFGPGLFDYAGDSSRDLSVWRAARYAILVNVSQSFAAGSRKSLRVSRVFPKRRALRAYIRSLRVHHWVKNILILAPLVGAHRWNDLSSVLTGLVAFLGFSLCASGTYVANDLLDLGADRKHVWKRGRPFASGDIPIRHGFVMAPLLFAMGVALSLAVAPVFAGLVLLYAMTTLLYSFYLKKIVLLDVVVLASFYTMRMWAGSEALRIPISFWMLAFTMFLFLSLALSKRFAELDSLSHLNVTQTAGRDYSSRDVECLRMMGLAAGYAAVVVLALYVNSMEVAQLYQSPRALWLICMLVLYWISWIWMKASRGEMHEDPLVFALKDRTSYLVGVVCVFALVLAVY